MWPVPETVRDVQSFLGFVNFYGDFIDNTTLLTSPLYELTVGHKGADRVHFDIQHRASFDEIKKRLCGGLRLAHLDMNKLFVLYTDASKFAVGAVLLQQDDVERAISFYS